MAGAVEAGRGRDLLSLGLGFKNDLSVMWCFDCEGSFASVLSFV